MISHLLTIYQLPETSIYPDWLEAAPGSDCPASSSSKTDDTPLLCAAARQRGHWELFSRIGTTQARWKTWEQGSITSKDKSFVTSKPQTANTSMVKTKGKTPKLLWLLYTLHLVLVSTKNNTPFLGTNFNLQGLHLTIGPLKPWKMKVLSPENPSCYNFWYLVNLKPITYNPYRWRARVPIKMYKYGGGWTARLKHTTNMWIKTTTY